MKHGISRQRLDPVLAPGQFGVAQPLGWEDFVKHVTRHDAHPSFLAPTGVPWSEYIMSQRNRSRSVSSSTEALDSDHARYITSRITQHARSNATGTRSLPTYSSVPYFQPLERGHVSEGVPSDPTVQIQMYFLTYPLVVLNRTLMFLNRIEYLPTLVSMTTTLHLRLDMVGEL